MISDYSQKIAVSRVTVGEDHGFGGQGSTETQVLSTWAAIKEVSRQSLVAQGLNLEQTTYKVSVRYASGREIKQRDFVTWNGNKYRVLTSPSTKEIDKKKYLEFLIVGEDG